MVSLTGKRQNAWLTLFCFALFSFCSCQQPIVFSSGQTNAYSPYNARATQYSLHNSKPNDWKRYGSIPTKGKYYGSMQTQSKYYGSMQTQNEYYESMQTQSKFKRGNSVKKWGSSYSAQSQQLKNYKGFVKPKVLYTSETLKTKPYSYRLRSVGRTLIDQYLQNYMPWDTCTAMVTNTINTLFNPTSDFMNIFINAGVDNWCGNKLYALLQPVISPFTDRLFENLDLARD